MANRRKNEAERKWKGILRTWKDSGLKASAFCRQQQVNPYVFYRWKKRLGMGGGLRGRRKGAFLPVRVLAPLGETAAKPWVEVLLSNGRTLRVWRESSLEILAEMAAALETGTC